jgi:hypothetical protein
MEMKMQITYRREIKHNYMIIDPEEMEWEGYESRMLQNNSVEGVLPLQIRQTQDGIRFYYDITSRQPLLRLLEAQKWRAEQIRRLLIGIFGVLERMENYLLRDSRILLDPEYIYVDPENTRIWLCIVPGLMRDFPEDFGRLLEKILEYVDHQDKESVVLAYGIYQETRKTNYGIDDIMCLVREDPQSKNLVDERTKPELRQEPEEEPEVVLSNPDPYPESCVPVRLMRNEIRKGKTTHEKNGNEYGKKKKAYDKKQRSAEQKSGLIATVCQWIQSLRHKKNQEEMMIQVPWEMMFQEEEEPQESNPLKTREEVSTAANERNRYSPDRETQEEWHGTTLLTDLSCQECDRRLCAVDADEDDIRIAYYPFVIGKQESLVDYCLNRDTVSRLHVRFDRDDGRYYITDLNSSNGTMLRGNMMENNEKLEIFIGDEVLIAQYRYVFR